MVLVVAAALPVFFATPAAAQLSNLDDAEYIEGLRRRGMKEVLLYYLDHHPPDDPVVAQEIRIEQHKLRFEDDELGPAQRQEAVEEALAAYRDLLEAAPASHWKRPIWRTDFVRYVAEVALPRRYSNAAMFVEFGVPTAKQRRAHERLVPEALEMMSQATDEMFFLEGDLPRREDFQEEFVNPGRWRTLRQSYGRIQLPYYRAWAHYQASLLEDPRGQLGEANEALKDVLAEEISEAARPRVHSLRGRVLLAMGRVSEAIDQLDRAIGSEDTGPMTLYEAQLAKAMALDEQGEKDAALALVAEARGAEFVRSNPLLLVLGYDRQFRLTGDHNIYEELFDDPAVERFPGDIRSYVIGRFVREPRPPEELTGEPAMVLLAQVNLMLQRSQSEEDESRKSELLRWASETAQLLAERQRGVSDDLKGRAMFKRGVAEYQRGRPVEAAEAWIALAQQWADHPMAARGAVNAFVLSRSLYQNNRQQRAAVDLYDRAQRTLLEAFGDAQLSSGNPARIHWHTRGAFLRQQDRWREAIEAFERVPQQQRRLWIDGRYQAAVCRYNLWREAAADQKREPAEALISAVDRAVGAIDQTLSGASDDRAQSLLQQRGDLVLRKAEVLSQTLGRHGAARAALDGFDQDYGRFDDLLTAKRELMVAVLLRMGRVQEAFSEVEKFIDENPAEGGPLVRSVLESINHQVEQRKQIDGQWKSLAEIGVRLAEFLRDWAEQQEGIAENERRMLAFRSLLGRQYLMAERCEEAASLFDELYASQVGRDNVDVVYGRARAHYCLGPSGGGDHYETALAMANRVLRSADDTGGDRFWRCWVMRLSVLDHRYNEVRGGGDSQEAMRLSRRIFSDVRKLELRDEQLGGDPFREELQRLRVKHQPM